MGKGDKKSKRGKIWGGSCGVRRPKRRKMVNASEKFEKPVENLKKTSLVKENVTPKNVETVIEVAENQANEIVAETKSKSPVLKKEASKKPSTKKVVAEKETKEIKPAKKKPVSKTKKEEKSE